MKEATFTKYPADWARSSHFAYYTKGFVKSVNSMTVRMDVTHFLAETKKRGLKFFPAFAALCGQLIASIPEMCTNVDKDGQAGYYSYLNANFTIFHEDDKTFSDVWSEYDADFDVFYQNLLADTKKYQDKKGIKVKDGQPANFFCISCVPWLSFDAYCPVNYSGSPNLFPILTFGKYTEADGAFTLPLTLTISHACMDGYHLSLFFNTLQKHLDCF
nr:CatA-like O-acetyltransferase [uncultured Anaerotignum sp.]